MPTKSSSTPARRAVRLAFQLCCAGAVAACSSAREGERAQPTASPADGTPRTANGQVILGPDAAAGSGAPRAPSAAAAAATPAQTGEGSTAADLDLAPRADAGPESPAARPPAVPSATPSVPPSPAGNGEDGEEDDDEEEDD